VVEEALEVLRTITDTLLAIGEGARLGAFAGFHEEQGAGGGRLEGAARADTVAAAVDDDAGAGEQAAVLFIERAGKLQSLGRLRKFRVHDDAAAVRQAREPRQPGEAAVVRRRGWVLDQQHVEVALGFGPGGFEEGARGSTEVSGAGVGDAGAG